jgi:hypothetical protein
MRLSDKDETRINHKIEDELVRDLAEYINLLQNDENGFKTRDPELLSIAYNIVRSNDDFLLERKYERDKRWKQHKNTRGSVAEVQRILTNRGKGLFRLERLLAEQHNRIGPFYITDSVHDDKNIGLGIFSMIPIKRGQCLFQFTGRISRSTQKYLSTNDGRQDYSIQVKYNGYDYVINPLRENDTEMNPLHYAGYINEPSAPNWFNAKKGKNEVWAKYKGEQVLVKNVNQIKPKIEIMFQDGSEAQISVDEAAYNIDDIQPDFKKRRANVMWYDFPVPVTDLYEPYGRYHDLYVYARTNTDICNVRCTQEKIKDVFQPSSIKDQDVVWNQLNSLPKVGQLIILRDDVFEGLERCGLVLTVKKTFIIVRYTVFVNVSWRLPPSIFVAKYSLCDNCKQNDNLSCLKCKIVPFPMIYACSDIKTEDELLCLYECRTWTRGLPCKLLSRDCIRPRWSSINDMQPR